MSFTAKGKKSSIQNKDKQTPQTPTKTISKNHTYPLIVRETAKVYIDFLGTKGLMTYAYRQTTTELKK